MAQGPDGRWTALDGRALFGHAKTAGYLYQAALRVRLGEALGVQWGAVREGSAEVQGVPRDVVEHFSRRRAQIREAMALEGGKSARAAQLATVRTRRAKQNADPARQREEWRSRAAEFGFGREQVQELVSGKPERARLFRDELVAEGKELAGAGGLTRRASTFDRRDAVQRWAAAHRAGARVAEVESITDRWLGSSMVREVDPGGLSGRSIIRRGDGRVAPAYFGARYSTAGMLELERDLVATAERRRGEGAAVASDVAVQAAVSERASLREEQVEMVQALCGSGDGVQVVLGRAGTGKTYALAAAREAWEQSGVPVCGAALSATAARQLESETGIPSRTVAQLNAEIAQWGGLDGALAGGVLVVDEGAMVGTRDLKRLVDAAGQLDIAVKIIGDDAQLPEIDAGGALRGLAEREGAVELRDVQRQRDPQLRAALEDLRDGEGERYLTGAVERGAVSVTRTPEAQRAAAIEHWWTDVVEHGHEQTVLLASRHADRRELNELAREHMRDHGRLGERELEVAGRGFSEGDRVIALQNRRSLGLLNADRGTVHGVTEDRGLDVALDDGRQVKVPVDYLEAGHLDLGYAMTVHKAQGATFERAHFLGDETVYRELAYTAATRGREETRFYVVAPEPAPARRKRGNQLEDLAWAIGDSRAKQLALDVEKRANAARDASQTELERRAERVGNLLREKRTEVGLEPTEDVERLALALADHQARLQATQEKITHGGWRASRNRGLQELARVQDKALEDAHHRFAEACAQANHYKDREGDWWQRRTDALSDAAAARLELDRRTREQTREAIQAAPYEPAEHITALIGDRDGARDVGAWDEAARRIEAYHRTHQPSAARIEPPGPSASIEQRHDWLGTREAITRTVDSLDWQRLLPTPIRGRGRDGPDLGMDMGF